MLSITYERLKPFQLRGPSVEMTKTLSVSNNSKPESKEISKNVKVPGAAPSPEAPAPGTKSNIAPTKQTSKSNDQSKDQSKDNSKDKEKAPTATSPDKKATDAVEKKENQKRVSHNVEMDHCSLEED